MAGMRGVSWRREEILDLLALWGEKRIQDTLQQSYRNLETFEEIARRMAERGHHRSAVECRTKTKGLRLEYKRAVLHNSTSGNARATCPFYEELHRILCGNASIKPRSVASSFYLETVPPSSSSQAPNPTLLEESGELSAHSLEAAKEAGEAELTSTGTSELGGLSLEGYPGGRDTDDTIEVAEHDPGSSTSWQAMGRQTPDHMDRDPDDVPPGAIRAELSTASRLAIIQAKRKRVSTLQWIGETMLRQSAREHADMMEARRREHEQFLEEMRACREEERQSREFLREMMGATLTTLSEIARAITQPREEAQQTTGNQPQDNPDPGEGASTSGAG